MRPASRCICASDDGDSQRRIAEHGVDEAEPLAEGPAARDLKDRRRDHRRRQHAAQQRDLRQWAERTQPQQRIAHRLGPQRRAVEEIDQRGAC
jgi:hypothetical protein